MGIKTELYDNFDYEIIDEFLDHYTMMVESMDVIIIDLSKPKMYRRSIDELFRVFHNIKSASGFLKLDQMNRLAMLTEDVLDDLRSNRDKINELGLEWLLEVSTMFATWLSDIKNDNNLTKIKFALLKIPDLDN